MRTFHVGLSPGCFRGDEPAEIIGVEFISPEGCKARPCFKVRFLDGVEDHSPVWGGNYALLPESCIGEMVTMEGKKRYVEVSKV